MPRITNNRLILAGIVLIAIVVFVALLSRGNSGSIAVSAGGGTAIGNQYNTTNFYGYPTNGIQQSRILRFQDGRSDRYLRAELDQECIERINRAERIFLQKNADSWLYELSRAKEGVLELLAYADEYKYSVAEYSKKKIGSYARMEADNAFGNRDYDSVGRIVDKYHAYVCKDKIGELEAYRDMASVLSSNKFFVSLESKKLARLRECGCQFEYLNLLADAGMLDWHQPAVDLSEYDGLLGFQPRKFLKSFDDEGNPIYSCEFVRQYRGLNRYEYVALSNETVDFSRCVRVKNPDVFNDEVVSEKTFANLMPYILASAGSDMAYDENRIRQLQICKIDASGVETVEGETLQSVPVPEATSGLLLLLGMGALALRRKQA